MKARAVTPRYYGWRIAWTLAVTQTVGYGVLYYAFGVLIEPMEAELGWSRGEISGAFSLALLLSGVAAVPVGRFVDARGARGLMTLASLAGAALVLTWSFVTNLTSFYFVQAGLGLVMAAALYEVAFTVVAVWFRRERARALLLVTTVAGLASTIFVPLTTGLVHVFGWRDALRVLALVLAATAPLHAGVLRRHPRGLGLEPDGTPSPDPSSAPPPPDVRPRDALRVPTFWWLTGAFALDRVSVVAVAAHGVPILGERGYAPGLVAAAVGSIGLMQIAGRLMFVPLARRAPLRLLCALVFGVHALGLLALLVLPGGAGVWLFALLFGAANGAGTLARAALIGDLYGSAHYGGIGGSMATAVAIVGTAAPLGAGALHDLWGGYDPVLWGLVGLSALAGFAIMRVRP